MTTIELNAKKAEIIKTILNDVNTEFVVNKLERVVKKLAIAKPCRYTQDEIVSSAQEAIIQYKGKRYTSHEEIKRFIESMPQ